MNACYVLLRFPVLSETFIKDEVDALREAGHRVMTVSLEGGPGADVALSTRRARSPWTVRRVIALALRRPIPVFKAMSRPVLSPGLRLKVLAAAEECRRRGVDCVHAHFAYRNADGAEIIGMALGTGHSVTVHAHDIFVENSNLQRRLCAARRVITVCRYNQAHLERTFPVVGPKTTVIPCSTRIHGDPNPDEPSEQAPPPGPGAQAANAGPVILSVGRLVEKKGFDDLLRAFASMSQPSRLVIVGDGPLRSVLDALSRHLSVSDRVRFVGSLDHEGTLAWYGRADIFCLACKVAADGDRDSMPVVTKEAMAAGLPVVSTDEVGVPEMVEEGMSGILVPPSDPAALADALDRLVSDPGLRASMGTAGRRLVAERFNLEDQARRVAKALVGP